MNNIDAFLYAIRCCEGTASPDGYKTLFGGELFSSYADHPNRVVHKSGYSSSAAGAYQILYKTWNTVIQPNLNLPDFSPESQDKAAMFLIANRGALEDVIQGRIEEAVLKCNKEWASLPESPYGQPTYSMDEFLKFYNDYKPDIKRVEKIDVPKLGSIDEPKVEAIEKNIISTYNEPMAYYAVPKDNALERVFDRVLETIAGENKAGKVIAKGKDVVSYFVPLGREIDTLTDQIGNSLKSKTQPDMAQLKEGTFNKIIRFLKQESTRRGVAFVVGLLGAWFSIDIQPDLLIQSAVGIVSGLSLIYAAWKNIKDIFVDEDAT